VSPPKQSWPPQPVTRGRGTFLYNNSDNDQLFGDTGNFAEDCAEASGKFGRAGLDVQHDIPAMQTADLGTQHNDHTAQMGTAMRQSAQDSCQRMQPDGEGEESNRPPGLSKRQQNRREWRRGQQRNDRRGNGFGEHQGVQGGWGKGGARIPWSKQQCNTLRTWDHDGHVELEVTPVTLQMHSVWCRSCALGFVAAAVYACMAHHLKPSGFTLSDQHSQCCCAFHDTWAQCQHSLLIYAACNAMNALCRQVSSARKMLALDTDRQATL